MSRLAVALLDWRPFCSCNPCNPWKEWAYTDGSCQIHQGTQVTCTSDRGRHVQSCYLYCLFVHANMGYLVGVFFLFYFLLCQLCRTKWYGHYKHHWQSRTGCHHSFLSSQPLPYCHCSLSSLHQIRKQLLYPELHCHHKQGDILKMLIQLFATHQPLCTFSKQVPRCHCWKWVCRYCGQLSGSTGRYKPCRHRDTNLNWCREYSIAYVAFLILSQWHN